MWGGVSDPAKIVILIEVKSSPEGWPDIHLDAIETRNGLSLDSSLRSE